MRSVKKKPSMKRKMIGLGILVLCLSGILFWQSPYYEELKKSVRRAYETAMIKSSLVLGQVTIEGHYRTRKEDIMRVTGLVQGTPIWDVPITDIQKRVEELPWVKSAVIERHMPGQLDSDGQPMPATLYIRLTEKEPVAVWQDGQKYLPLDATGKPIQDTQTPLADLLLVVGKGAPEQTPALLEILERYPDIRRQVRSAVRVSRRRWNLMLNDAENGVVVKLPETGIGEALARLTRAAESEKLLKRDLSMIDLRQNDRLIVRLKEGKK